jgi:polyhydroxyalkanoate synthesis regulator phasin
MSATREKAEEFFNDMAERGEITRDEAHHFVDEVVAKGDQERRAIMEYVGDQIQKVKLDMGMVSRKEYDELLERIRILEERQGQ